MPRYFFIVAYPNEREISELDGVPLLNDTAAIKYAHAVIDALRRNSLPREPKPRIVVKNVAGEVVFRFPTN
jgi:hypothetical protein